MPDQISLEAENERLRQLNKIYRDALAFAGHEWRTQISLLSLSVSVLQREAAHVLNEHHKETLARIALSAAALLRIARGYLSLSQAGRESFPIRPIFVDPIREIVNPVLFSYTDMLKEHEQSYVIQGSQPAPLIWADREMLTVVLDNLIGNAIKHGERGGRMVLSVLERGHVDEISVWNSGPGISPEQARSLFEPLATLTDLGHEWSSGIGLYLARKIVEAHGGQMIVESWPGAGVKLVFTLPKHRVTGGYQAD